MQAFRPVNETLFRPINDSPSRRSESPMSLYGYPELTLSSTSGSNRGPSIRPSDPGSRFPAEPLKFQAELVKPALPVARRRVSEATPAAATLKTLQGKSRRNMFQGDEGSSTTLLSPQGYRKRFSMRSGVITGSEDSDSPRSEFNASYDYANIGNKSPTVSSPTMREMWQR